MRSKTFCLLIFWLAISSPPRARAQSSPFLKENLFRALANEISGDIAYEHIRWFTHYHRPMGGSEGFEAVAAYVEQKARDYGLDDVRRIDLASDSASWTAELGELWLIEPEERRLAFSREVAVSLADYSRPADVSSAELVDVGRGTADVDYAGKDVAGKVVLAGGPQMRGALAKVMEEAVWKRGALGIITFTTERALDYPDQVPWMRIPVENREKTEQGTFAFVLSYREGARLRDAMAAAGRPFLVRAKVESSFRTPASQAIVEALIRGTEIHDQDIVLTGHLQEERFSANDDASGCSNVLEIGRALKKLIDERRVPRPRRDIRLWWVDEISAEEQYFSDHPEERSQILVDINQDMVGAKQSAGSRVQFVTRPPFSRAGFLGSVVQSIVESLVEGNTSYLAAGQARQIARGVGEPSSTSGEDLPFSRPILSRLGTREHYDARLIPFHNSTDHQVFNMGIIGIPAVTFTNWPDEYIHSTDDDLWQIDPTQLKRNAVAVAAAALYLASAGEREVPELVAAIYGGALERMGREASMAMRWIVDAAPAERPHAYSRAATLVRQSARRERQALDSVRVFATKADGGERLLAEVSDLLPSEEAAEARLAEFYRAAAGEEPPERKWTPREKELRSRIPSLVASVKAFLAGRGKLERPRGLHPLMAYEALNFVDGTRSYLDIYEMSAAEADAAGAWYYGEVTLEDVASYLDSAERAGMLTVETRSKSEP